MTLDHQLKLGMKEPREMHSTHWILLLFQSFTQTAHAFVIGNWKTNETRDNTLDPSSS